MLEDFTGCELCKNSHEYSFLTCFNCKRRFCYQNRCNEKALGLPGVKPLMKQDAIGGQAEYLLKCCYCTPNMDYRKFTESELLDGALKLLGLANRSQLEQRLRELYRKEQQKSAQGLAALVRGQNDAYGTTSSFGTAVAATATWEPDYNNGITDEDVEFQEINQELTRATLLAPSSPDFNTRLGDDTLSLILSFLPVYHLLPATHVCTKWRNLAMNSHNSGSIIWRNLYQKSSYIKKYTEVRSKRIDFTVSRRVANQYPVFEEVDDSAATHWKHKVLIPYLRFLLQKKQDKILEAEEAIDSLNMAIAELEHESRKMTPLFKGIMALSYRAGCPYIEDPELCLRQMYCFLRKYIELLMEKALIYAKDRHARRPPKTHEVTDDSNNNNNNNGEKPLPFAEPVPVRVPPAPQDHKGVLVRCSDIVMALRFITENHLWAYHTPFTKLYTSSEEEEDLLPKKRKRLDDAGSGSGLGAEDDSDTEIITATPSSSAAADDSDDEEDEQEEEEEEEDGDYEPDEEESSDEDDDDDDDDSEDEEDEQQQQQQEEEEEAYDSDDDYAPFDFEADLALEQGSAHVNSDDFSVNLQIFCPEGNYHFFGYQQKRLIDVRYQQSNTGPAIDPRVFRQVLIYRDLELSPATPEQFRKQYKITPRAIKAIQEAAEAYLLSVFENARRMANMQERRFVSYADLNSTIVLRGPH